MYYQLNKNFVIKVNLIDFLLILFGDWGLGIGDWGLGIEHNPQSPIPKSPISNPQNFYTFDDTLNNIIK